MVHLPELIRDLSLILITAGIVTLLFRWMKQPVVLGYLAAGLLVSPQVSFLPTVKETENIKVWGELGVIFLLFVLGLEFSFRKLLRVGRPASVAALVEVIFMGGAGYALGLLFGWSSMDSLFLGGILSISSTTIIIKAFQEQGIKTQSFASLVYGILIIEDLLAVLLLTILAAIGATKALDGLGLLKQSGLLMAFLAVVIPFGLWAMPKALKFIRSQLDDEARVVVFLGLCLGLVLLADQFGFSAALGAFLMGTFLGETVEGERSERFFKPIRDLFGAIFFTSVGMLVDIEQATSNLGMILTLSVVTIVGKIFFTAVGAQLGGQDRNTALQAGLSLGQIGEFSFIIAALGLSLGVIKPELYPISVSVAIITTFTTPYLIRWAALLQKSSRQKSRGRKDAPRIWNAHLVELEIHPHFRQAGETLNELRLREKFGVSLVALHRGDRRIVPPGRNDRLMPLDRIIALGTDAQLADLEHFLHAERFEAGELDEGIFGLTKLELKDGHPLIGKTLRASGIREQVHGIVLGIERRGNRHLNPDSTTVLEPQDVLWVYGDREEVKLLARATVSD